ncbi:MAG: RHS repeat-associated core domain-containing protein, partial [Chitinophagaceae bacterium]|nr:RHS repeat-associated core domain-containing protein [Chitinophagaceae bacterium]
KKIQHTEVESNALPPAYTTVSENEYDALGRLQKKTVGSQKNPSNNTYYNPRQPLQEQVYEYNIRGWLLNMNKGYMSNANTNQYFSMELGYDKDASIGTFTDRYDGNISGVIWKSEGDQQQRKYDFTYDDANRLTAGEFTQYVSGLGSSAVFNTSAGVDYSVSGLTYDANGNIKTVTRKGLILNTSPVIDQLTYSHKDAGYSNRLAKVTDAATSANSGKLGDFNDGNVGGTDDYGYDINGNLTADLNKGISSIMYNFLNLPQTVTMPGKGAITYVYDAVGNRLKKVTVEDPSAANGNRTITTTITYVGAFVYESKTVNPTDPGCPDYTDKLLFAGQEEGRIRAVYDPSDPNILTGFAYDYFVKDHLGNTRIVLTEEQKQDVYPAATMETAEAVTENIYYGNIDLTRFAKSGISGYPVDEATDPNDYVAKTDGDGNNIGPSIFLKVMAGDQFTVQVSSWYKKNSASPVTPADPLAALIAALAGGVSHASPVHGTATALINSGALDPSALGFLNSRDAPASGKPKAYLNWVLLDEQLKIAKDAGGNIIASGYSGADQVGGDEEFKTHAFANMPVKKSGYLYIYTSNETPNIDVFFDNLQVTHTKGPILEESHYYPYGMKMAGISSKAYGSLKNLYQYQGEYAEFDEDTGWNDFELRSYDAQTGRFIQQDPYDQFASPYMGMGNNPVSNVDEDGGWSAGLTGSLIGAAVLGGT